MVEAAHTQVALLTADDEHDLLAFELENRQFFARGVGDRGDDYFTSFTERLRVLVDENASGTSLCFSVRDGQGRLIGRVNIGDIHTGTGDLGYRIGEDACGRGHARAAVRLALRAAAEQGVSLITAMTTVGNVASQRILLANGFEQLPSGTPARVEIAGRPHETVHFARSLATTAPDA